MAANTLRALIPRRMIDDALAHPAVDRLFPTATDRAAWTRVPEADHAEIVATAERLRREPWPILLASDYARFAAEGDRAGYENPYYARRTRLTAATLAAALTGDEDWIADVVDGLWLICEETTWTVPAHAVTAMSRGSALPAVDDLDLDLFAAETGALLAWADHLLGAALDDYAPTIRPRVRDELITRVLEPFRVRRDWRWLVTFTNNWNPWIHSNVLSCALLTDLPAEHRAEIVDHVVTGLDRFLDSYPDDGGCDEGATYWGRAGGSLSDCLSLLYDASGGVANGFQHPLAGPIAGYLPAMHIADQWYVNFADGPARLRDRSVSYALGRIGRHTDQPAVVRQAQFLNSQRETALVGRITSLYRILGVLFDSGLSGSDSAGTDSVRPAYLGQAWLPDTQVCMLRQHPGRRDGMFMAIKGGHNNESHNHNDVGSFIVGVDGVPRVVDIGVGLYTRQTFGPDRYELFTMQSDFHNVPKINGFAQPPGSEYRAGSMTFVPGDASCRVDIATAYPAAAQAESWERELALSRESGRITLTDSWRLGAAPDSLLWHLIVFGDVTVNDDAVSVRDASGARGLVIGYDAATVHCAAEPVPLSDQRLTDTWGRPSLTRLRFTARAPALTASGTATWTFSAGGQAR